ncbi:MAG: LysM domain-containing protein [Candidatus Limnocylindrales bacterium]|nr:LysM domain-containing protein [Candidatus Limnocylindrales bacterium]
MSERELPSVDGAPACPFVAFEDDREGRATSPDHRHRCYAELVPSPRAAAHQEAYCLSSAFPVCPTFQDWARREAAHARGEGERPRAAPMAQPETAGRSAIAPDDASEREEDEPPRHPSTEEPPIRRNPPRDWAAPPPWAPRGAGAGSAGATRRSTSGERASTPDFLAGRADESRGLAGSAADRLAVGPSSYPEGGAPATPDSAAPAAPDAELAGLVAGRHIVERPAHDYLPPSRSTRRPSVSSTRTHRERERERDRDAIVGPSWERARRYEAYPTIRTRAGLPAPPRLAVLAGALVIAAVALFFLPALLGVGGGGEDASTPGPSASQGVATASPEPTTPPAPTPQIYVIKSGDTLFGVAESFGLTLDELLEANKDTITDPDKIAIGDQIIIPPKPPDEFTEPSAEPS